MDLNKNIDKYTYRIEWSEEDEAYIARCLEFPSLATHGESQDQALDELKTVVKESIEWLEEDREPIPEPFSLRKYKGNLTLRVPPQTHRLLAIRAAEEGVSINQFITSTLELDTKNRTAGTKLDRILYQIESLKELILQNQFQQDVSGEVSTSPFSSLPKRSVLQSCLSSVFGLVQIETPEVENGATSDRWGLRPIEDLSKQV